MIISHRGNQHLHTIENTLEAFQEIVGSCADMVEFDVRRTRDGEFVVNHDPDVCGKLISQITRAEASFLRGYELPLLSDVLEILKGHLGINVELKENGHVPETLTLIDDVYGRENMMVSSFLDDVVRQVKHIEPNLFCSLLLGRTFRSDRMIDLFPVPRIVASGADGATVYIELARKGVAARIAQAGYPVNIWHTNEDDDIMHYLKSPYVQAIITDVPVLAHTFRSPPQPLIIVEHGATTNEFAVISRVGETSLQVREPTLLH